MTSPAVTWLDDREAEAIRFLEALVNQDSGTYDRDDVDTLADMLAHNPDEYIELPTLIERALVNARFIELWAETFAGPRAR